MAAVVAGVVAAARVEVAGVVVVTMAVVLVSPPTLYKPSATVLFHFVLKLIFSKKAFRMIDVKKLITRKPLAQECSSSHQKV